MTTLLNRRAFGTLALGLAAPVVARAQSSWPTGQVRLVVPFGAGGAVDTLSRIVANAFGPAANGQTLVVENRSGAGGTIAGQLVAQARPDGSTLMMADLGANAIGKILQPALAYDPVTAFTPIIHLVNLPIVIIVRSESNVRSLADLIALARSRPDGITYASPGVGHVTHLAPELLARRAGVKFTAVHYRSGSDVLRSLLAGETEFTFPSVSTALPFIRDGKARALAIGTSRPVPALPGIPPVSATYAGFEAMTWHGIEGPAGMDPALANRINAVFRAIITNPEVKATVETRQAAEVTAGTPADFAKLIADDVAKWTPVIREGNIRAE
jgi:tripartite-type tricarboxylate transporter receptor subunit TctC